MNSLFETTNWTLVLEAASSSDANGGYALEHLCKRYRPPLLQYARAFGLGEEDAQDVTQSFFQHLLEKNLPARAQPDLGRFRCFLLSSMRNFMRAMHRNATAEKRGGDDSEHLRLDEDSMQLHESLAVKDEAGESFDRSWAHALIENALNELEEEQICQGHEERFRLMRPLMMETESRERVMKEMQERFGMNEGASRTALSRLRARFREMVRFEVARVVADPAEVDDEISYLIQLLR